MFLLVNHSLNYETYASLEEFSNLSLEYGKSRSISFFHTFQVNELFNALLHFDNCIMLFISRSKIISTTK